MLLNTRAIIALLLAILGGVLYLNPGLKLVVEDLDDSMISSYPLGAGETFQIQYIHSVDRSPVVEVFLVNRQGDFLLQETYFRMFGAGMGHWEGHGELVQDGEWVRIRGIDRLLTEFVLRPGSEGTEHTLIYRDKRIDLREEFRGSRLAFRVERNYFWSSLCQ